MSKKVHKCVKITRANLPKKRSPFFDMSTKTCLRVFSPSCKIQTFFYTIHIIISFILQFTIWIDQYSNHINTKNIGSIYVGIKCYCRNGKRVQQKSNV